jgi:hypothetical protein
MDFSHALAGMEAAGRIVDGRTAGYGIYRDTNVYRAIADQMAQQSPLSNSLSVQNLRRIR